MESIWKRIDQMDLRARTKFQLAIVVFTVPFGLAGLFLWLILRGRVFSSLDWMLCFIGYPILFSLLAVIFYSFQHDFHERSCGPRPYNKMSRGFFSRNGSHPALQRHKHSQAF